jgi:hypothetical protein
LQSLWVDGILTALEMIRQDGERLRMSMLTAVCVDEIESFEAGDTREDHKPAATSTFLVKESTALQSSRFQALIVRIDPGYSCGENRGMNALPVIC